MATSPKSAAPAATATRKNVRRISAKNFKAIENGKENAVKIAGIIRGTKMRPDPTDSSMVYPVFIGDFRAAIGAEVLVSAELILPSVPETALRAAHEKNGEDAVTTFCYSIYKEKNDASPRKFDWKFSENKPTSILSADNDPVMQLLK